MAIVNSGSGSDLWSVDSSKAVRVSKYDSSGFFRDSKATFAGSITSAGIPASTRMFYLSGSSSKLANLQRVKISGIIASAVVSGNAIMELYRTPFTGGTLTFLITTPFDSFNGLKPTTVPRVYSSTPNVGVAVGLIGNINFITQSSAAVAGGITQAVEWDFRTVGESGGIPLRGPDQGVSILLQNLGAIAMTAAVDCQWTEE